MAEFSGSLTLSVVTPEGSLYEGPASFVAVPASDGELGVLTKHTPLIAKLGIGDLRIEGGEDGVATTFAVRGGFLQVVQDEVTLLVTEALAPDAIDTEALKAEREEILEKLQHPASDEDYRDLLDDRRWVETRERVGAQG